MMNKIMNWAISPIIDGETTFLILVEYIVSIVFMGLTMYSYQNGVVGISWVIAGIAVFIGSMIWAIYIMVRYELGEA